MSLIKQWLPTDSVAGQRARRLYRRLMLWRDHSWQSELLQALAQAQPNVSFVQVGSNDAGYGDPLRFHILQHGWRGLMIEPLPYVYRRLQARYADVSGLQFANVAIDKEDGERLFYHLRPSNEPGLPPWYDQLGSFLEENVLKHQAFLPDLPERVMTTAVRCKTFDNLCLEHGISHFDVLHIDAEGYDHEILCSIDLSRYEPIILIFEHKHLSLEDFRNSLGQLRSAGYQMHSDPVDTVAVHTSAFELYPRLARTWRYMRRVAGRQSDARQSDALTHD